MLGFLTVLLMGVGDFSPDGDRDRPDSHDVLRFNLLFECFLETFGMRLSLSFPSEVLASCIRTGLLLFTGDFDFAMVRLTFLT
jgi:hypothetical protein